MEAKRRGENEFFAMKSSFTTMLKMKRPRTRGRIARRLVPLEARREKRRQRESESVERKGEESRAGSFAIEGPGHRFDMQC